MPGSPIDDRGARAEQPDVGFHLLVATTQRGELEPRVHEVERQRLQPGGEEVPVVPSQRRRQRSLAAARSGEVRHASNSSDPTSVTATTDGSKARASICLSAMAAVRGASR